MIKDTSTKNKRPLKASQSVENSGFIRLIVLVVVIVGVMVYFKIQPQEVWDNYLKPVIDWGIDMIVDTVNLIFKVITWIMKTFKGIYNQ